MPWLSRGSEVTGDFVCIFALVPSPPGQSCEADEEISKVGMKKKKDFNMLQTPM